MHRKASKTPINFFKLVKLKFFNNIGNFCLCTTYKDFGDVDILKHELFKLITLHIR